jgi:hypothetical protein
MRTPITEKPEKLAEFTRLARAPGHHDEAFSRALTFLVTSPHYATADDCYEAAGGDEKTSVLSGAGKPLTFGALFLRFVQRSYRDGVPEFLRDGRSRHFDGRPPTPIRRLSDDPRAAYQVRHYDMMERFDEAMTAAVRSNVRIAANEVTPELVAYVTAHAGTDVSQYFEWLSPEPARKPRAA